MTKPRVDIFAPLVLILLFWACNFSVTQLPRVRLESEMRLSLPPALQIIMAGGDRYLAANIGVFRALMVGVHDLQPETYDTLASVQRSAAVLNPSHEDNYYTANAILPWNEKVTETQEILQRATNARTRDFYPPFFLAFNRMKFERDIKGAVQDLLVAAERAEGQNKIALKHMAANWTERSDDARIGVAILKGMAGSTRDPEYKRLLEARSIRLSGLVKLRDAASSFSKEHSRPPLNFDELVQSGYLTAIPHDPFQIGYRLDAKGIPQLGKRSHDPRKQ